VIPLKATRPREGRTAASPWALGGLSVRGLATRVYLRSWHDEILDRAAELSYYFAFALLPTLLFLTALLGLLPVPDLMSQLIGYVERVLPGDAASLIKKTLAEAVRGASGGLVSVSALVALVGASSGMLSIMKALNAAYGITDQRTWRANRCASGRTFLRSGRGEVSGPGAARATVARAAQVIRIARMGPGRRSVAVLRPFLADVGHPGLTVAHERVWSWSPRPAFAVVRGS
jgi:hypothetical protein